jgi:S-adenosylmethionine uptake transporter
MLVSTLSFALMAACVKLISSQYNVAEILFYRFFISALVAVLFARSQNHSLLTPHWKEHGRRACFGTTAMAAWYYTLSVLPLATSSTLNYTSPIFVGVLTALAAKRAGIHTVGKLAYLALGLGFMGVLILLRPTADVDQTSDILIGLAGAFVAALSFRDVRRLAQLGEPEARMVLYFCLFGGIFSAVPMLLQPIHSHTTEGLAALICIGLLGSIGQFAVSRAFGKGNVLLSAALQYTGVIFATLIGMFAWGEVLPVEKMLGIATIVCAGVLSAWAVKRS